MKVEFLSKFSKDIDKISTKSTKKRVIQLIQQLEQTSDLNEIRSIKKLVGFSNAYRIRLGDFRVGLFLDNDVVTLARILHRKDIYKLFP
jgi:mRNA interferase RelE/StbE